MSVCARCGATADITRKRRWCAACEREYDGWSRQYASDIIAPALGGIVVVLTCAMLLPWAGASVLVALGAAFGGFAALGGLTRLQILRRRRQFLRGTLPRAYLPGEPVGAPPAAGAPSSGDSRDS